MTEPANTDVDSARAWSVAGGAFLALFTVFGVVYSFGEFFGPMADEFGSNRSKTAMFFSITTFVYFVLGLITGRLADRVGQRKVLLAGAVAIVAGLFLTSKVSSLEMGYLTYGAGVGFGVACCFVPMVAGVGGWFVRQRTLALGVAVSGIGVGTLVVVPFSEWLIGEYGWRTAYQILAALSAVLLLLAAVLAHRPPNA
ncbi:MAG: MFS transporter, partial [Ilumatobacteraceae bacterium]